MKKLIINVLILVAAHLSFTNLYAHATDTSSDLIPKTESGISYVNGGVGKDEQEAISKMRRDYNLQLTLAEKSGPYVADVTITIESQKGKKLFEATNMGPLFLAKLAPGSYKIKTERDGKVQSKSVVIGKGKALRQVYFYW